MDDGGHPHPTTDRPDGEERAGGPAPLVTYRDDGRAVCSCDRAMTAAEAVRHTAGLLSRGRIVSVTVEGHRPPGGAAPRPAPTGAHSSMTYDLSGNGTCSCGWRLARTAAAEHVAAALRAGDAVRVRVEGPDGA